MRTALLNLLPLVALTAVTACGDGTGLPTGSWHHGTSGSTGTGGPATTSSGGGSNGATSSSGGSTSSSSSSGGSTGSTSSSGGGGESSGSSSGGEASSGSSSGGGSSGMSSGGSSGAAQASNVAVSVAQTAVTSQLLAQTAVPVSVAPNGYSGTVQLSAGTLPAGITASFDKSSLTLDGSTTATAQLTLQTETNAPPGDVTVDVQVMADGTTKSAQITLTVQSVITLHIPQGINNNGASITNPDTTAFGPYPITMVEPAAGISAQNPITVYFQNDDTVAHEIHADAQGQGFGHDPGSIPAGKMDSYVRKVNTAGTYDFYLHDQGSPKTIGRIHIQ